MDCDICGTRLELMDEATLWCPRCHWQYIELSRSLTAEQLIELRQNRGEEQKENGQ